MKQPKGFNVMAVLGMVSNSIDSIKSLAVMASLSGSVGGQGHEIFAFLGSLCPLPLPFIGLLSSFLLFRKKLLGLNLSLGVLWVGFITYFLLFFAGINGVDNVDPGRDIAKALGYALSGIVSGVIGIYWLRPSQRTFLASREKPYPNPQTNESQ
jgi:hypothetical protein